MRCGIISRSCPRVPTARRSRTRLSMWDAGSSAIRITAERARRAGRRGSEGGRGLSVAFLQMIFEELLGEERGPRFGSFVALCGIRETCALIDKALAGELAA